MVMNLHINEHLSLFKYIFNTKILELLFTLKCSVCTRWFFELNDEKYLKFVS